MRLFTALDLDQEVSRKLEALTAELKTCARLRWSSLENLHITTKFIGEWPAERQAELAEKLPTGYPEVPIAVEGLGFFPNDRYPKIFFARVEPSAELLALAQATDKAGGELGIPLERHPYRPHITLARIPESVRLHPLRDRLAELNPGSFGRYRTASYSLFESNSGRYTRLVSFPLGTVVA